MHAVAPLIDESSGESPLTVEYPGNGVVRFNAAIRVAIKRYNHAVTWATRHFISLISISKKYESNFKEISKLHLLVVIYECTSGQRKHSTHHHHPHPRKRHGRQEICLSLPLFHFTQRFINVPTGRTVTTSHMCVHYTYLITLHTYETYKKLNVKFKNILVGEKKFQEHFRRVIRTFYLQYYQQRHFIS